MQAQRLELLSVDFHLPFIRVMLANEPAFLFPLPLIRGLSPRILAGLSVSSLFP